IAWAGLNPTAPPRPPPGPGGALPWTGAPGAGTCRASIETALNEPMTITAPRRGMVCISLTNQRPRDEPRAVTLRTIARDPYRRSRPVTQANRREEVKA